MSAVALDVFYPIVPDAGWLERLVPLGVRTVQMRLKDAPTRCSAKSPQASRFAGGTAAS